MTRTFRLRQVGLPVNRPLTQDNTCLQYVMVFLLFCALGLSTPPNFPQLPSGYEWKDYISNKAPREYYAAFLPGYELPILTDSSYLPYTLELKNLKFDIGKGDSLYGWVRYTTNPAGDLYARDWSKGIIQVDWGVHKEQDLTPEAIMNYFLVATARGRFAKILALKEKKVEQISIGEETAYRIHSYWWHYGCDGGYQFVGALTFYFIPGKRLYYMICCATQFYTRTPSFDQYQIDVDEPVKQLSKYERIYPDRIDQIRDLEQAVEQTFRPK
jgi:hypothetical protein